MQPVKIICRFDPFETKLSGVSKEEVNGVVTKKGEQVWGKSRFREG